MNHWKENRNKEIEYTLQRFMLQECRYSAMYFKDLNIHRKFKRIRTHSMVGAIANYNRKQKSQYMLPKTLIK